MVNCIKCSRQVQKNKYYWLTLINWHHNIIFHLNLGYKRATTLLHLYFYVYHPSQCLGYNTHQLLRIDNRESITRYICGSYNSQFCMISPPPLFEAIVYDINETLGSGKTCVNAEWWTTTLHLQTKLRDVQLWRSLLISQLPQHYLKICSANMYFKVRFCGGIVMMHISVLFFLELILWRVSVIAVPSDWSYKATKKLWPVSIRSERVAFTQHLTQPRKFTCLKSIQYTDFTHIKGVQCRIR